MCDQFAIFSSYSFFSYVVKSSSKWFFKPFEHLLFLQFVLFPALDHLKCDYNNKPVFVCLNCIYHSFLSIFDNNIWFLDLIRH